MTIDDIYEAACLIKYLVEENDRLKEENDRLRLSEKENRATMSRLVQTQQDIAAQTLTALLHFNEK